MVLARVEPGKHKLAEILLLFFNTVDDLDEIEESPSS